MKDNILIFFIWLVLTILNIPIVFLFTYNVYYVYMKVVEYITGIIPTITAFPIITFLNILIFQIIIESLIDLIEKK